MASTIRDVVKLTGLSIGTVSKYINGGIVKESNRILIESAIRQLDFKPNQIAKGLKNSKTNTVGIIVPSLANIFSSTMITNIEKSLWKAGYGVIVCTCQQDEAIELEKVQFLIDKMVDGIILQPHSSKGLQIDLIKKHNLPVLCFDAILEDHPTDGVVIDNRESSYTQTSKLIKMGHRKIAIIYGDDFYTSKGRLAGYIDALTENGISLNPGYICQETYTVRGGFEGIKQIYSLRDRPTAVLVTSYDMTIGAFVAINALKLKIPEDISIIGFDNLSLSEVVSPKLSITEQPMEQMGISAAQLLLRRMKGDTSNYPEIIIYKTKTHIRGSVRKIE